MSYPAYAAINHKYWESDIPYFLVADIRNAVESASVTSVPDYENEEDTVLSEDKKTVPQQIVSIPVEYKKNTTTEEAHESSSFEIHSTDKEGVIGYDQKINADDPADNIFSFHIDKNQLVGKEVYLTYEVYGIENVSGISKSINYENSTGGYFIKTNNKWKVFQERISPTQLKNGENHIMFTIPEGKNIRYYIRNAKLVVDADATGGLITFSDNNKLYTKNNRAYLKGTLMSSDLVLFIDDEHIPVDNESFEYFTDTNEKIKELSVRIEDKEGTVISQFAYPIDMVIEADETIDFASPFVRHQIKAAENELYHFGLSDVDFFIHGTDYEKADKIAVQRLRQTDIAPLGSSTVNVTQHKQAFRFTPDGAVFANPAQLVLRYERDLLPEGYTDSDISVMYFDTAERKWKAVQTDSIQPEKQLIYAKTTHFTDYIAGIIQAPESPETTSFTPTSISDIKIADPTANIVQIQPPSANQKGDGTIDFPIIVPPGRHGLQPNLSLSYNNNGGSSFVGYGWDLSIPYITVDTKFGVPEYHSTKESESYLLNGEELMLKSGSNYYLPHRQPTMVNRVSNAVFYPKIEGSFSKIERKGSSPSSYYWIVTDKSGTKYYYGQSSNSRFTSSQGNIAKWMLERVEDKNGNYMTYGYITKTYSEGNLAGGKEILVGSIRYTLHAQANNYGEQHIVDFTYGNGLRSDRTINYRYGFKEVNAVALDKILITSPRWGAKDGQTHNLEYTLNYSQGKFGKLLLSSIDTKNISLATQGSDPTEETYSHTFEYYDDTQEGLFGPEITVNAHDDIDDEPLATLGGSVVENSPSIGVSVNAGVYLAFIPTSLIPISNTLAATFDFMVPNSEKTEQSLSLIDMDGDGLPDKLVKKGDDFKYRKNVGGVFFSNQLYEIENFHQISSVTTRTTSKPSFSLSLLAWKKSFSNNKSVSESNIFMTDVNADGLIDYVKDKIVYFNRIDPNSGKPTFTDDSSLTPNRIIKENDVDNNVLAPLPDLRLENDLMDVVKVWVAPKEGRVDITGTISKQFVSSDDGVRFSVESSRAILSGMPYPFGSTENEANSTNSNNNLPIPITNYIIEPSLLIVNSMPTNANNIYVRKGDMLFFRVNSSQLPGEEPISVNWNPKVTYTSQDFDSPNQYKQYSSQYSDSFVYGDRMVQSFVIKKNTPYSLIWDNFTINNSGATPQLSDDVSILVKVYKIAEYEEGDSSYEPEDILQQNYYLIKRNVNNSIVNPNLPIAFPSIDEDDPETYVYVKIEVKSDSQINWKTLDSKFKPRIYNAAEQETTYLVPEYQTHSNQLTSYYKSTFNDPTQIQINNYFDIQGCTAEANCEGNEIYLVVKNQMGKIPNTTNGHSAKFKYTINTAGMVSEVQQYTNTGDVINISPSTPSYIDVASGTSLYFEYYSESKYVAHRLKVYQNENNDLLSVVGSTIPPKSDYIQGESNDGLYKANIFSNENVLGIGSLYRNWGQFAYKGAMPGEAFDPIKKSYIGALGLAGLSTDEDEDEEVTEEDIDNQADGLMDIDPEELDYDSATGEVTGAGQAGTGLSLQQIEAMKHFTTLTPDRVNSRWKAHNKLYAKSSEIGVYFRFDQVGDLLPFYIPDPQGISPSGAVSIIRQSVSESEGSNQTIGVMGITVGKGKNSGFSKILNDYQDVNGDGYPDIMGEKVQLTSFRGGLSNKQLNENLLFGSTSSGEGRVNGGSVASLAVNQLLSTVIIGANDSFSLNLNSENTLKTVTTSEGILLDINGDGLADKVLGNGSVAFNNGEGFASSTFSGFNQANRVVTKLEGTSSSLGYTPDFSGLFSMDVSAGIAGSDSNSKVSHEFMDINGDGLADYISDGQIKFNTGTGFISSEFNLPRQSNNIVTQVGITANINFNYAIPIFPGIVGIRIGAGGTGSLTNIYTRDNTKYMDFDGDGYIDMLYSTNENNLKVRYSKIGRTNMLKKVNNPTGSQMIMDYDTKNPITQTTVGNNYKMPFKKWVLTKVRVHDGFESDGEDVQTFAFEYFNGLKDRRERKFLGFGEVRTHQLKTDGAVYRTSIKEYMLNNMQPQEVYLAGISSDSRKYQYIANLLVKETVKDGANRLFSVNEYDYAIYSLGTNANSGFNTVSSPSVTYSDAMRILPLIKENKVTQRHYQGTSTTSYMEEENRYLFTRYDKYGNVTQYRDDRENLDVEITYHDINTSGQYIVNIPKRHDVKQGSTILRSSGTELSPQFNVSKIHRIKTLENAGQMATTDFQYDAFGNLTKVMFPKPTPSSSESERFFYRYEYSPYNYFQYANEIIDAYGFESKTDYTNFGMPTSQIDPNGIEFHYFYDPVRRLKQFKGPYNEKWTIRNEYKTAPNGLRYAVTIHNITDEIGLGGNVPEQDYQLLHTSTFADGLGRIIQTKKQLDVYQECENATATTGYRFAVSGKVVYDEFGRTVESYLGQEQLSCNGDFVPALESYEPLQHVEQEKTSNFYDSQDRVLQNHVHGLNATTEFEYGYGNDGSGGNKYYEKVILPEGNITQTFKDYKGRTTATHQIGDSETLVTAFRYDPLSQLMQVTDAEGKITAYQYDSFGNKMGVNHPDNGISQFKYDLTGKLVESRNQNLINAGQSIQYKYHFNQLTDITYPSHTVQYKYGTGTTPYDKGRLIEVRDLTGVRNFEYGALGEVVSDKRALVAQNGLFEFNQTFRYDSWGRMMEQTYPDGEELAYTYNSVGQLKAIENTDPQESQVYLRDVKYNFFDQPTEILYGNDVKTTNEYDITQRIRAMQLDRPDETTFMRNVYSYDANQNITQVQNTSSQHNVLHMGGMYNKNFYYDSFNRLNKASIGWSGHQENHEYSLDMKYNKTHGIVMKGQHHARNGSHTINSYTADYLYEDNNHPHAPSYIKYTMNGSGNGGDLGFKYDANGNIENLSANGVAQEMFMMKDRRMFWDEQNRLLAVIDDSSRVSHYVYDHAGERTFKAYGDVSEINIGGNNIYQVLDVHKYTMYPSGNMVVNIERGEATKHYYINEKRFASRIVPVDAWIKPGNMTQGMMTERVADMSMIVDNTDIDSEEDIVYAAMSIGNPGSNCTAQLQTLINNYTGIPTRVHCVQYIQNLMSTMSPCDALVAANEYVCVDIDPVTGEPVDEEPNTPDETDPGEPLPPEVMDCITELNLLIADYTTAQAEWEEEQFGAMTIYANNDYCCDVYQKCVTHYWDTINLFMYLYCQTSYLNPICEGLPEEMYIPAEIEEFYIQYQRCIILYFNPGGDYEQGLELECYPMDCKDHSDGCDGTGTGVGDDDNDTDTDYGNSCYSEALEYIDTHLLEDQSNACEVYYYVIKHFKCIDKPQEPETPGDHNDTEDEWEDDGGNDNDPVEDPYDESQRKPIWWYHSDHLGSSSYITDNFGRPSHYYEYLPFGELMTEHNQSKYYIDPYPTQNMSEYNNPYKFNGKEMDRETGMYYYGARYYDP
ncbi:SpvB/TcaC N-terminal domain-containing protein, partial [Avrilella dinanensis]|uniref:SpvB/TcaC N-terminal domain-containing protein n=1 Tax=Avrilella dinanensis TaxID=2008672 RepID=UPI00240A16F1